jgi:hypothetical protein
MSDSEVKKDLLSQLLYEAQAYKRFEDIEKLVDSGVDLSALPIQPLYVSLQNVPTEQVALILPKLSPEQRQALRDIDLWKKDQLDPDAAFYWLDVFAKCPDDAVILEYVKSEDFLLSLKNQFTVQTFDVEDPEYPEGDNYFLTEDNLLLIEYPESFTQVQELKELIRRLYGDLGVEHAYAFLFKMVVDSYLLLEEEVYNEKRERLRDFGFVDYYEALEYGNPFTLEAEIEHFIRGKRATTPDLDPVSRNQGLHASSLVSYQSGMDDLKAALATVADEKRREFLQFSFVRLVNARITLDEALKNGTLAMGKVGAQTRQRLELGFCYVAAKLAGAARERLFETFDFFDLYKVGNSLIELTRRRLARALAPTPFEADDFAYFLGTYWNSFLENGEEDVAKYKFDGSSKAREIADLETYELWNRAAETLVAALPYIQTFFRGLEKLKTDGQLNDQFYLNYDVENIDFEALMISSFINFLNGFYDGEAAGKMGVTVDELRRFYRSFFAKRGDEYLIKGEEDPVLREQLGAFIRRFGLATIPAFDRYLYQILVEQLNGYEMDKLGEEDFRHIGGPILLNTVRN